MTDLSLIVWVEWIYEREREKPGNAHDKLYLKLSNLRYLSQRSKNNPKYLKRDNFYKAFLGSSYSYMCGCHLNIVF